ncbi:MAG: hypothetical protein WDN69_03310 [Aliidongia sp.]
MRKIPSGWGKLWPALIVCAALLTVAILARVPEEAAAPSSAVHAVQPTIRVTIDPETNFQPRFGEVKITVQNIDPNNGTSIADIPLSVHFRWQTKHGTATWEEASQLRTIEIPNTKTVVLGATLPELPDAPSSAILGVIGEQEGMRSFLTLVPVLEVWVTGQKPGSPAFAIDQVETIGVTTFWVGALAAVATVALLLAFLHYNQPDCLKGEGLFLRIIETDSRRASLSQFQIILWTLVIGASTAYVMAMSGNLIPLTSGTLILLGISSVATLGSALAAGPAAATRPPATPQIKPEWSDLVSDNGQIDVTRMQMLFFTVLMAIYVVGHVIDTYQIPPIPESFLTLMGISNGVYLANKFLPSTAPAKDQTGQKLLDAGYAPVDGLAPSPDGSWTATATEAGPPAPVRAVREERVMSS